MVAFLLIGGIGFFMLVLTWILGELFDLGHGLAGFFGEHVGDVSVEGHHLELGHHVEGGGMPAPSPLSSRVIFAFMTAFGGGGAAASVYGLSTLPSVGIGLGSGLVIGGLVYGLTLAVFRQQATSGFEVASLVGKSGRVVIAIPAGGTGQVSVADGTDEAAHRLNRVLTNDPGIGVARHVDAGYEEAEKTAREKGIKVPMLSE